MVTESFWGNIIASTSMSSNKSIAISQQSLIGLSFAGI
jgi:hypothetical protein